MARAAGEYEPASTPLPRSERIIPLRPRTQEPLDPDQQREQEYVQQLDARQRELYSLSPEAINAMYLTKRPGAIDRRNTLIKENVILPSRPKLPGAKP